MMMSNPSSGPVSTDVLKRKQTSEDVYFLARLQSQRSRPRAGAGNKTKGAAKVCLARVF